VAVGICQAHGIPAIPVKTPFFRTGPLLYHKLGNMVRFRSANLYSLCSSGNQDYQKIIYVLIFLYHDSLKITTNN